MPEEADAGEGEEAVCSLSGYTWLHLVTLGYTWLHFKGESVTSNLP